MKNHTFLFVLLLCFVLCDSSKDDSFDFDFVPTKATVSNVTADSPKEGAMN